MLQEPEAFRGRGDTSRHGRVSTWPCGCDRVEKTTLFWMTAIYFEWNGPSRHSQCHGACLPRGRAAIGWRQARGGVREGRDWLTARWRGGTRLAATVKIGKKRLALLCAGKTKKKERRNTEATPKQKKDINHRGRNETSAMGSDRPESWAARQVGREKVRLPSGGEESAVVSTIVGLPGTLCNSEQLGQLRVFRRAINKEWKRQNEVSRPLLISQSPARYLLGVRETRLRFSLLGVWVFFQRPGCFFPLRAECSMCLCLNLEGPASQLVISGGRHGVHLAKWHAPSLCSPACHPLCSSRWLI